LFPVSDLEPGAWLLAGVLLARAGPAHYPAQARARRWAPPSVARARARAGAGARGVAAVALAAVTAVAAVSGARGVVADRATRASLGALSRSDPAAALAAAGRAVSWAPGDLDARLVAARAEAATGTPAGVTAALGQVAAAEDLAPGDPVVAEEQASLLLARATSTGSAADWRSARSYLAGLAQAEPHDPQVLLQLGVADASTDQGAGAVAAFEQAAYLSPSSPAPLTDLALWYARHGESEKAAAASRRARSVAAANQIPHQPGT
ncbi:MAG: tetratricopeptide repeat protein, partial [Acidimicrobiales bacterium]